jgi:Ca2+-binding EF-hand superfamily protein
LPAGVDWETKCIRAIRDWMFKNSYSSETAFELLLQKVDRVLQKKITRSEFHRALSAFDIRFSAAEVDALFKLLDLNQD